MLFTSSSKSHQGHWLTAQAAGDAQAGLSGTAGGIQYQRLARCGNPFRLCAPDGVYRIYAASGEFLLLAQVTDGTAVTIKSFFEVS